MRLPRRFLLMMIVAVVAALCSALPVRAGKDAAPAPTFRGERCERDDQCGWDDPCSPRRCQKGGEREMSSCGDRKTGPHPPGECLCLDRMCTRKSSIPEPWKSAGEVCERDGDCAVDVPTATCHSKGQTLIGPISREGPFCACNLETRRCEFRWSEAVPCKSFRDCSYERQPRLRPVKAATPRTKKARPCADGEADAICQDGFCTLVSWSC